MKITPPSSASDRRVKVYNYVQAVTKLPMNFPASEFEPLLRRINPELAGKIRSLFIVLSDNAFKKILRSRKDQDKGSRGATRSESSRSVSSNRSTSEASVAGEAEAMSSDQTSSANPNVRKRGATSPAGGSAAKK